MPSMNDGMVSRPSVTYTVKGCSKDVPRRKLSEEMYVTLTSRTIGTLVFAEDSYQADVRTSTVTNEERG